jgi:cytochrome P450
MRHFGPPERPEYLEQLRPQILRIVTTLLDQVQGQRQIDFIERFAYPLPVTVICRILGVPRDGIVEQRDTVRGGALRGRVVCGLNSRTHHSARKTFGLPGRSSRSARRVSVLRTATLCGPRHDLPAEQQVTTVPAAPLPVRRM